VEVDGGYHQSQEQKDKDTQRDKFLTDVRNFAVVRIKNESITEENEDWIVYILTHSDRGSRTFVGKKTANTVMAI
jgi:very-short-patch-repair endonuclease